MSMFWSAHKDKLNHLSWIQVVASLPSHALIIAPHAELISTNISKWMTAQASAYYPARVISATAMHKTNVTSANHTVRAVPIAAS